MKKKIIALSLMCIIIISLLTFLISTVNATTYTDDSTGITWSYIKNGTEATNVYVSSYRLNEYVEDLKIPETISGLTVTSIGSGKSNYTILGKKSSYEDIVLRKVSIPRTVTRIEDYTFRNSRNLKKITIPDSVTTIGNHSFENCTDIQQVLIPSGVAKIGDYAFGDCLSLNYVNLSNVQELGEGSFYRCRDLAKIEFPQTLIKIGAKSFQETILNEISFPSSVTTIGDKAFWACERLSKIEFGTGITSVGLAAFYDCTSLTDITLPENATDMGDCVFQGCTALKTVTMNDKITEIPAYFFEDCTALNTINFKADITYINYRAFYNCRGLESIILPKTVNEIEESAFENCINLQSINLGTSITRLGENSFYNCYSLKNIILPNTLETLDQSAFQGCSGLVGDLNIPDSVTSIGEKVFYGCESLNGKLVIGEGVVDISDYAFSQCNFSRITLKGMINSIKENSFSDTVTDIWIDQNKDDVNITENLFKGRIHFKNCKHKVVFSGVTGIDIKEKSTNNILKTKEYDCESNIEFYLDIANNANTANLSLIVMSVDENGKETIDKNIALSQYNGESYRLSNILFDRKVIILNMSQKADLTLRTFISDINDVNVGISREPKITIQNGKINYLHTKQPVVVDSDDLITCKVRIYNEGGVSTKVTNVKEYLPDGLELVEYDKINIEYGWTLSDDGKIASSNYLSNTEIAGYDGTGLPQYVEMPIILKVTAKKQVEDVRLVNIAEIASATSEDNDSNYGNITNSVDSTYKYDEAVNSTSDTYVKGNEEDDDFENVLLTKDVKVSYQLEIKKIDMDTKELLNGAEFDLLDENEKVLKKGVTAKEGIIDFGIITKPGAGVDRYYISEVKTPEGYEKITKDKISIEVTRTIKDIETGEYGVTVKSNIIETEKAKEESEYIPITTREQLEKIGSDEEITIDGQKYTFSKNANYELKNDIDLSVKGPWTPINEFNGKFNGNNYTINGLIINVENANGIRDIGLFGKATGEISNLKLENINIAVPNMKKDLGDKATEDEIKERLDSVHVGGIAGYFETGTIRNCTVSGQIYADSNSTGGFVGYSNGYMLLSKDTNNVAVTSSSSNAGGLIGWANSSISVVNCSNTAQIVAQKYNAGGIVGYAKSGEYKQTNINIAYINSKITILIENKKISDKYSLTLENRDIDTLGLLKQGKFTIYDVAKKVKYENVILDDGTLKVADIDIKKLGTDTYYIEQVQAQNDYNVNNRYVKLIVSKTWDGINEKYDVSVDYKVLTKEQFEKETATDESYSSSSSGKYYTGIDVDTDAGTYVSMSPVIDTISVKNSTNTGNIIAGDYNAAGIIAKTTGNVVLSKCSNDAMINSKRSSGIIGETLEENGKEQYLKISDCSNNGNLEPNSIESAGIVGRTTNTMVTIIDSKNTADINAATTGGIVAEAEGKQITINNCKNTGEIRAVFSSENGFKDAAGIMAHAINKNGIVRISECENTGNIIGDQTSGIVAYAQLDKIFIDKCKVNKCNITTNTNFGGMLAFANSNITITNCDTEEISNSRGSNIGGIVGMARVNDSVLNVTIAKCNVKDSVLNSDSSYGDIAGIIAKIDKEYGMSNDSNPILSVVSCEVNNAKASGGIGSGIAYMVRMNGTIIVKNSKFISSKIQTQSNFGGMLGYSSENKSVLIDGCNLKDINITNSNRTDNFGGMVGYLDQKGNTLKVINSSVDDCTFDVNGSYANAGIVGTNEGDYTRINNISINNMKLYAGNVTSGVMAYAVKDAEISDINVSNSEITSNKSSSYYINTIGTILAYQGSYANTLNIKNINITNLTKLETNVPFAGGILGITDGKNLNISDCSIISDNETKTQTTAERGAGGLIGCTKAKTDINNVTINNMKLTAASDVSGIIAISKNIVNVKNISLSEIDLVGQSNAFAGGIVADLEDSGESEFDNIEINKINIDSDENSGGIIGQSTYSSRPKISNVKVKDLLINIKKTETNSGRNIGGIVGFANSKIIIDNAKVDNIELNNATSAGGILGNNIDTSGIVSNSSVKDIKINTSKQCVSGGIVGLTHGTIKNSTISNLMMTATNTSTVGGVVGLSFNDVIECDADQINLDITSDYNNNIGALAGMVTGKIENCNVTNGEIKLQVSTGNIGGLVGYSGKGINGCTTNLVNINTTKAINNSVSAQGGLVGMSFGDINNCKVSNGEINIATQGFFGGIVGNLNANITNSTTDSLNAIITKGQNLAEYMGGIAAYSSGNIENCNVLNGKLSFIASKNIGGIVGQTSGEIINCNTNSLNMTADASGDVGGIVGYSDNNITKCNVINGTINSTGNSAQVGGIVGQINGEVINCNTNSLNMTTDASGAVGGIVGYSNKNITKCNVINGTINSTGNSAQLGGIVGKIVNISAELDDCEVNGTNMYNVGYYSGGIAGYGEATIKNSRFIDSNISVSSDSAFGLGGIVGQGTNLSNRYTYVVGCKVKGSTIQGKAAVGGIVGASVPYIKACSVEDSNIIGDVYVGGIIGYGGDLETTSPSYTILPVTVTNCTLTDLKIKAANNASEVIGYNSFNGESDTITDTTVENCEVIGADTNEKDNEDVVNTQSLDEAVDTAIDEDVKKVQLNKTLE